VKEHKIYSVGHSVHPIHEFTKILHSAGIELVADVRSYPVSHRHPQFNLEPLSGSLAASGIIYMHLPALGGRREPLSYLEHMKSKEFAEGILHLETLARDARTAYMCAEADWRHCHRSLISDHLASRGWEVIHILGIGEIETHPATLF
jgi:uncharacterized protein (DUF488 family)